MKQRRKRLSGDGVVCTNEFLPLADHSLLKTDSRGPRRLPLQSIDSMSEFIVRRERGTNAVSNFLLDRCNDRALRTARHPVLLCKKGRRACYRRILVPVDFTETGRIAAEFAIACFPCAQIVFLHAFQVSENSLNNASHASTDVCSQRLNSQERAIARLVQLTDELRPSDNLVSRVAHYGSPFSVIANYALRMDADLILIGTQEEFRLKELLRGSAASRIANCTNADVLVMPPRMHKQGTAPAVHDDTWREHRRTMPALSFYKI